MTDLLQTFTARFKQARRSLGLGQAELGARVGLPQSHISKIEQGTVDIQLSTFIQLAHALELELVLIPKASAAAVKAICGASVSADKTPPPAYRLDNDEED
jgi:HTH-type transcriptional regulator/antitoxin HipB